MGLEPGGRKAAREIHSVSLTCSLCLFSPRGTNSDCASGPCNTRTSWSALWMDFIWAMLKSGGSGTAMKRRLGWSPQAWSRMETGPSRPWRCLNQFLRGERSTSAKWSTQPAEPYHSGMEWEAFRSHKLLNLHGGGLLPYIMCSFAPCSVLQRRLLGESCDILW